MQATVKSADFQNAVDKALEEYRVDVVDEAAEKAIRTVTKAANKRVKQDPTPIRTGSYRKSFAQKVENTGSRMGARWTGTVYAKAPKYRLTHLLEHGHKKRGGNGTVKAYPHLEAAQEAAGEEFVVEFEKELKRGG